MEAKPRPRLLLVPSVVRGNGTGHLLRCLELATRLDAAVYLSAAPTESRIDIEKILRSFPAVRVTENINSQTWKAIVIDKRSTSSAEAADLAHMGHLIGIDEGGPARDLMAYLIDILPPPPGLSAANRASRGFITLPQRTERSAADLDRVLISFGGEDPVDLSSTLCRRLVDSGLFAVEKLTVVRGPANTHISVPDGANLVELPGRLRESLADYDLVFTSFGLTAYEAAAAGCAVVLLNPSRYHEGLARREGFPSIGVKRPSMRRLAGLISDPSALRRRVEGIIPDEPRPLWQVLDRLETGQSIGCPSCGSSFNEAVARFPDRSYFRCSCSGLVYQISFSARRETYGKDYFFEEYRKQYGKTYLEDFDYIRTLGGGRLEIIDRLTSVAGTSLLDVGCAFGPFLSEASARGADCYGFDVSEDAVRYVRDELGIHAVRGNFETADPGEVLGLSKFGIVTMWYVIEHFEHLERVLQRVSALLPSGGVFAFSTPNLTGVTGRTDRRAFLEHSPADHRTVWSPASARRILKTYGLRVRKIRVTGHHPERFPFVASPGRSFMRPAATILSRVFGLGDTFEVYATKE